MRREHEERKKMEKEKSKSKKGDKVIELDKDQYKVE